MTNRTEFEAQCDKISDALDKLSDWEMLFYMYCLIPRFADKLEAGIKEMKTGTFFDAVNHDFNMMFVANLRRMREDLVQVLF
jgi:hypothetical protein